MIDTKQWIELCKMHRVAFCFWFGFAIYMTLYCLFSKHSDGVTLIYYKAASYWLTSQNVYLDTCPAFVYFPQSAVLFLPFALFPFKISNVLWHLFLTGMFASSLLALVTITSFPKKTNLLRIIDNY